MLVKTIFLTLCLSLCAFGVIPLPYPLEPIDEELFGPQDEVRDPKMAQGYQELFQGGQAREMELPHFEDQPGALGYDPAKTFKVPPSLRSRVDFWIRIFSEFTSNQAVLHDAYHPEIIYEVYDITRFNQDPNLSYRAKVRAMNKFFKVEKKKIHEKLLFLHANQNAPLTIPMEMFPLFRKFERLRHPDKFLRATKRIRTQVGQRDRLVRGLFFGGRYFNRMMDILAQKGLPKELSRLPLVESSFDLSARSKVGASGVWQFMRSTGKRFLRIDRFVDERNDPINATWAAGDLLRLNFEALGSWPLAVTAYNHGQAGMMRAMDELNTSDLSVIIAQYESRTFGFASSNFFAELLAVLEVEREYRKHFGKLMVDNPIVYVEFSLNDNVMFDELADICNIEPKALASLNPALTDRVVSGRIYVPKNFKIKVAPDKLDRCKSGYRNVTKIDSDRWLAKER